MLGRIYEWPVIIKPYAWATYGCRIRHVELKIKSAPGQHSSCEKSSDVVTF